MLKSVGKEHELERTNTMDTTDVQKFTLGLSNANNTALANIMEDRLAPHFSLLSMLLESQASLIQLLMMVVERLFKKEMTEEDGNDGE